jgi:hypothetical protein
MIAANNHYAGFGPGTANLFRSMVGLPELSSTNQQPNNNKDNSHKLATLTYLLIIRMENNKVGSQIL